MHDQALINRLKTDPSLDKVYFNNSGGWLFVPNKHHTVIKTSDEVLAEHEASEQSEEIELVEQKDPSEEVELVEQKDPSEEVEPVKEKKSRNKSR